jgi:aconitate hydratase 2/2-methylisocitrate dehydratase
VAFAAATGVMPLDMPESVLVRFKGKMQPGVTLRDLVNAIPLYAIKQGLLTVAKAGKKNIFSGRILEIEGLPDLKVEQAFELSDASAERSAAACTVHLNKEPILEYVNSNITLMRWMIANGYADGRTLARRIAAQEAWVKNPQLLERDADAEYAAVIEIDLADIHEPIVACPNDPDDVKTLSEVAGAKIDEVFIGSCMTNIGHFRAASKLLEGKRDIPVKLWVAPPTKMDQKQLTEEGHYGVLGTRRRPHGDAGLLAVHGQPGAGEGRRHGVLHLHPQLPQPPGQEHLRVPGQRRAGRHLLAPGPHPDRDEYMADVGVLNAHSDTIYQYLNFDKMPRFCGGWPVTAALAIFSSCTILLSSTSQYSASRMRTASSARFGSVGPPGNQALAAGLNSSSFLAWSSSTLALPVTET